MPRLDNQLNLLIDKMKIYLRKWFIRTQAIKTIHYIWFFELNTNYSIKIAKNTNLVRQKQEMVQLSNPKDIQHLRGKKKVHIRTLEVASNR